MTELTDDVIAFLSEGTRTAKLGYVASDGRPLVAPVWFVVDDGQLVFNTGKDTAKGRALARDPRVVICCDDDRPRSRSSRCKAPPRPVRTSTRCAPSLPVSVAGTWAPTAPRSSADATVYRANCWSASPRRKF